MTIPWTGYALVALGGALGALSRMIAGHWVRSFAGGHFPWHTFVVNILGSFLLGLIITWLAGRSMGHLAAINHFAAIGFLGAFTTFSTFELETWNLVTEGRWSAALVYAVASLLAGFAGLGLGVYSGRLL